MADKQRGDPDQIILELAAKRRGACTRERLIAAGVAPSSLSRRVKSGFLERIMPGLFVVPAIAEPLTPHEVALLAAPEGALSHETAARLHQFALPGPASMHLTVPKGLDNKVPNVRVHETRRWRSDDIVIRNNLRVTSPERTLVDLADGMSPRRLRHLVQEELLAERITAAGLAACADFLDHPSIRGSRRVKDLLGELLDDEPFPSSELEVRVFAGLAGRGITGIHRQFRPPWYDGVRGIVDGADPQGCTIIEADGRRWHTTTQAKHDDERRDRLATLEGWHVVRVGWPDVVERTTSSIDELAEIIRRRRAAAHP